VATINLDTISAKLGLTRDLQIRQQQLQQHFEQFRQAKQSQIAELQKKLPEKPTDDQLKEFRKADMEAAAELQRAQANANQQNQEFILYVRNVLNSTVKEPMDQVMKKRNLAIVLHSGGVYHRLDSADITDEVLEIIQKSETPIKYPTASAAQPTGSVAPKESGPMPELPGEKSEQPGKDQTLEKPASESK
jgi:Skp family chaperone for outer membrane proteins